MVVRIFGLFEINGLDLCGRKNLLYIMFCPFFFFFCDGFFSFLFAPAAFFLLKTEILLLRGRYQKKKNMLYCVSFYPQVSFLSWNFLLSMTKNCKACRGGGRGMGASRDIQPRPRRKWSRDKILRAPKYQGREKILRAPRYLDARRYMQASGKKSCFTKVKVFFQ